MWRWWKGSGRRTDEEEDERAASDGGGGAAEGERLPGRSDPKPSTVFFGVRFEQVAACKRSRSCGEWLVKLKLQKLKKFDVLLLGQEKLEAVLSQSLVRTFFFTSLKSFYYYLFI